MQKERRTFVSLWVFILINTAKRLRVSSLKIMIMGMMKIKQRPNTNRKREEIRKEQKVVGIGATPDKGKLQDAQKKRKRESKLIPCESAHNVSI